LDNIGTHGTPPQTTMGHTAPTTTGAAAAAAAVHNKTPSSPGNAAAAPLVLAAIMIAARELDRLSRLAREKEVEREAKQESGDE
jgi:peptidoglycan/LPS O-acetylase OafA/YrhL